MDCSARERSTSADWILIERVRQSSRSSVKSSNRNEPAFCNKTRSPADGPAVTFGFELFVFGGRFRGVSTGFCPFTKDKVRIYAMWSILLVPCCWLFGSSTGVFTGD